MRVVFLAVLLGGCSVRFFEVETLAGAEVVTSLFPAPGPLVLRAPASARVCSVPGDPPASVSVALAELQGAHDNLVRVVVEERRVSLFAVPTLFGTISTDRMEFNDAGRPTWISSTFLASEWRCFDVSGVPADRPVP
jgi:hypothetical protein